MTLTKSSPFKILYSIPDFFGGDELFHPSNIFWTASLALACSKFLDLSIASS
jgi:hypothetical protein